jgi:uncharacterized protein
VGAGGVIEVLPLAQVKAQPWRNGGGVTRELLAWPPLPKPAADWALRISVADIAQDGAFSAFPGVERWFAVLEGAGVVLRFAARREVLGVASAPLQFDGAAAPVCELQDGPTRDLNLMLRQGAGSACMQAALPDEAWLSAAPLRAVFCTSAAWLQVGGSDAAYLPAMALAWSAHAAGQRWHLRCEGAVPRALWMSFQPQPK